MISLNDLAVERPVGSNNNKAIMDLLCKEAQAHGLEIVKLPIEVKSWNKKYSFAESNFRQIELYPSPFSPSFSGEGNITICDTWDDVINNPNSILVFQENLTKEILMPLDFPVYFPPEHKKIYDIIQAAKPKCIITETGKHKMSGLQPYPYFEDGNLQFASAYKDCEKYFVNQSKAYIEINSECRNTTTSQVVFKRKGYNESIIIICAHMDSKYGTPGALDNAAGLYTLSKIIENLKDDKLNSSVHYIPFNGEENYNIPGQIKYLDYIKKNKMHINLVINIDSPGFCGSQNAISFYNIEPIMQDSLISKTKSITKGQEWYAGDHAMFAFQQTPCIVATSNNLFETGIHYTHTEKDTIEIVDTKLLDELASDLRTIVKQVDSQEFA